jgi:hypothetical protein
VAVALALFTALVAVPGTAVATTADDQLVPAAAHREGTSSDGVRAMAGWVRIRSLYGDQSQCLDADATAGGNGTKVQVWTCNGSTQQAWYSTDDGFLINGRFQSKCLDADLNGQGGNGTRLQLWDCNWTSQQQWWFRANDLAMYNGRFLNNFNTCVDRDTNVPGNGARAQLWQKNFQSQQWWRVE